jgi:hypothetical protein
MRQQCYPLRPIFPSIELDDSRELADFLAWSSFHIKARAGQGQGQGQGQVQGAIEQLLQRLPALPSIIVFPSDGYRQRQKKIVKHSFVRLSFDTRLMAGLAIFGDA